MSMNGTVSAPARICLMGEHQDYYGLASITAAIDLRISVSWQQREDSLLAINLPDTGDHVIINPGEEIQYAHGRDYLRSGLKIMMRQGLVLPSGYDIEITSRIPIAKGISSSSAFAVVWLSFLAHAAGWQRTPDQIAYDAYRAEVVEFHEAGGMMDQYTSAHGGMLHIDCKEPYTVTRLKSLDSGFLLGDTLTTKDTQGVLSSLKKQVHQAVSRLLQWIPGFSFRDTPVEAVRPFLQKIPREQAEKLHATLVNRDLTRQTFQLLQTNWIKESDINQQLGALINQHHQQLRDGLRISTPQMDTMIDAANKAGALGAKISGSGKGGFILVYAPGKEPDVTRALEKTGARVVPVRIDAGAGLNKNLHA